MISGSGVGVLRSVGDPGFANPTGLFCVWTCIASVVSRVTGSTRLSPRPRASILRLSTVSALSTSSILRFLPCVYACECPWFSLSAELAGLCEVTCLSGLCARVT